MRAYLASGTVTIMSKGTTAFVTHNLGACMPKYGWTGTPNLVDKNIELYKLNNKKGIIPD